MNKMSKKLSILIVFLIFLFSFGLRLWNLNAAGRTWDEIAYLKDGNTFLNLLAKKDFNNPTFYDQPDHPPFAKYLYGAASFFDLNKNSKSNFVFADSTFNYDLTNSRLVSVLFSSLTVVLVTLVGFMLSPLIGLLAGLILATLPFFLGLSQLVTIESILIFSFTASVYTFLKFIEKYSWRWVILSGVFLGFAISTKYTNFMLFPILIITHFLYWFLENKRKSRFFNIKLISIFCISLFVFFILWPMPWFHVSNFIAYNAKLRFTDVSHTIPEVFFGKLVLVPKIYFIVMFLITTPLLTLLSFFLGLKIISDLAIAKKSKFNFVKSVGYQLPNIKNVVKNHKPWMLLSIVIWFCFPFLQSFYNLIQHGVRYIIEIYAPLSLISAIGVVWIISLFKTRTQKIVFFLIVILYLLLPIIQITPYYLNYFNILVGGPKNVYEKRMFQLGWWGDGIKEASLHLDKTAKKGSTLGVAAVPIESTPPLSNLVPKKYVTGEKYDYVIVSYFNVIREGFDETSIKKDCKLVYSVMAAGAHLVDDYKCH
jgi:4-amino-4-deoxy-L-arabinose transferase-like glycosyltransferase